MFNEKNRQLLEMEQNPDKWFRETALPRYIECCKVAAEFVNAKWENVTLVRNTTQGELQIKDLIHLIFFGMFCTKLDTT